MSIYTNYIEGVFILLFPFISLPNPTVYKEVRVLKKRLTENREEKRSSVGRFAIFSFLPAISVKTEERAKSDLHLAPPFQRSL